MNINHAFVRIFLWTTALFKNVTYTLMSFCLFLCLWYGVGLCVSVTLCPVKGNRQHVNDRVYWDCYMSLPLSTAYNTEHIPHRHSANMTTNISHLQRHRLRYTQKHQNKKIIKIRSEWEGEWYKCCGFLLNSSGGRGEKGKRSSHYLREFQLTLSPSVISY